MKEKNDAVQKWKKKEGQANSILKFVLCVLARLDRPNTLVNNNVQVKCF